MPTGETVWHSTITIEVSSAAPDADPTWVDISNSVSFRDVGQIAAAGGRQTDLSGDDPAQLTLAVRDDDHAYSTGVLLRQARRIRMREHFGLYTADLIDANIQVPTTSVPMDLADGSQAEITVTISAVDKLARLRFARKFISTHGAHVRWAGGTALKAWWPLVSADPVIGGTAMKIVTLFNQAAPGQPQITWAAQPGPPGDDGSYVLMSPIVVNGGSAITYQGLTSDDIFNVPITDPYALVVFWMRVAITRLGSGRLFLAQAADSGPPFFTLDVNYTTELYTFTATGDTGGTAALTLGPTKTDSWQLIGMRLNTVTGAVDFWVDDQVATAVLSPSGPSGGTFQQVALTPISQGQSYSNLQFITGTDAQTNHAAFLARFYNGLYGLVGQKTGQRVTTILDYAGVPAGSRDIDPGVAVMSRASLAGKDPLTALEEARRTEQGRLFMSGDGRVQFRDRQRNYNI